jgi:hypothetical protein
MAAVTIKYGSNNQSKIFYPCMISLMLVLYKCMTGLYAGPPKEIVQGGTRLLWGPRNRLRRLSK